MADEEDELLETIPIRLSSSLSPNIHLHQFPLLTRPLQVPPSARASGKRIRARAKPSAGRYQITVPVDMRPEVWNEEKGREYGLAREEEDEEEKKIGGVDDGGGKKKGKKGKGKSSRSKGDSSDEDGKKEEERRAKVRLGEIRLRSERVSSKADYFIGVMRENELHLHPVSQAHQFRPTLTYLDVLARKAKPTIDDLDDEDDKEAPPEPAAPPKTPAREVVVAARDGAGAAVGGLTGLRRDMITNMRKEQEEKWVDMDWHDENTSHSEKLFDGLFSTSDQNLKCTSEFGTTLTSIKGLTSS